jgi:hypothetical protein
LVVRQAAGLAEGMLGPRRRPLLEAAVPSN